MRRHRAISTTLHGGDPGKDLFAYLFLMIMVFSFMLLMSVQQAAEQENKGNARNAPDQQSPSRSGVVTVIEKDKVAGLVVKEARLYLKFGTTLYDPESQIDRLEADGRIQMKPDGKKILFISSSDSSAVSLMQYLDAFKAFSSRGITIAFAKEV